VVLISSSDKVQVSTLVVVLSLQEGTATYLDLHTPKHVDSQYHECHKENFSLGDFNAMKKTTPSVDDENITLRRTTFNQMPLTMDILHSHGSVTRWMMVHVKDPNKLKVTEK
jgi:hypothetical protein